MTVSNPHELGDYEKWVLSNRPEKFSLYDYLHGVISTKDLSPDLVFAFLKLFWPEFHCIESMVFLKEEYSEDRHQELTQQGYLGKDLEYWMNLLNIDGLFNISSVHQCKYIGDQLVRMWESKLEKDYPNKYFKAECIVDDDEVYVVFYQLKE